MVIFPFKCSHGAKRKFYCKSCVRNCQLHSFREEEAAEECPYPWGCCNCKDLLWTTSLKAMTVRCYCNGIYSAGKQDMPDFPQQLSLYNPNKFIFPEYSVVFIKMPFRTSCMTSHFIHSVLRSSPATTCTIQPQHGHTAVFYSRKSRCFSGSFQLEVYSPFRSFTFLLLHGT